MFKYIVVLASSIAGILIGVELEKRLPGPHVREGQAHATATAIETITPDIFALPVLVNGNIEGFLICRFAVNVDMAAGGDFGVDDATVLADQFYSVAFNTEIIRPGETQVPTISRYADAMLENANVAVGSERYKEVYVQQVDYFSRLEVRRKIVEERTETN